MGVNGITVKKRLQDKDLMCLPCVVPSLGPSLGSLLKLLPLPGRTLQLSSLGVVLAHSWPGRPLGLGGASEDEGMSPGQCGECGGGWGVMVAGRSRVLRTSLLREPWWQVDPASGLGQGRGRAGSQGSIPLRKQISN